LATFYWVALSTNIIDSVTDHISAVGYPPLGNTYHLVEYVTADGISMATYIATNVQGFEDAGTGDIYVVRANLSDSVTGGITITRVQRRGADIRRPRSARTSQPRVLARASRSRSRIDQHRDGRTGLYHHVVERSGRSRWPVGIHGLRHGI